jgi:hypothetical protein
LWLAMFVTGVQTCALPIWQHMSKCYHARGRSANVTPRVREIDCHGRGNCGNPDALPTYETQTPVPPRPTWSDFAALADRLSPLCTAVDALRSFAHAAANSRPVEAWELYPVEHARDLLATVYDARARAQVTMAELSMAVGEMGDDKEET